MLNLAPTSLPALLSEPDTAIAASPIVDTLPSPSPKTNHLNALDNERYLVTSPYTDAAHLLDLHTLGKPQQLMTKALTTMHPLCVSYATTPYPDAFNWQEVIERLETLADGEGYVFPKTSFYVIVFRSRVPPTTDQLYLEELDLEAHKEAVKSGGLLKYWFGIPDVDGRNLATCLWRDRSDAKRGGAGKGHAKAMEEVRGLYLEWHVERLRFTVEDGVKGYSIGKWVD
ncbi:hypothetical protein BDD12DRAFT_810412 [Trichophaea hybrida]|nr:hypothetical protein BDD12DRAFT_810412 [Trichophaea hybrida]